MKNFLKTIAILMFLSTLSGCANLERLDNIDDYSNYLLEFSQYESAHSVPPVAEFTPLVEKVFDYAKPFYGDFAFARQGKFNYIVSNTAQITEISADLSDYDISYDKYAYRTSDGALTVCDVFGKVLLSGDYDGVKIVGDAMLATKGKNATIFHGKKSKSFTSDAGANLLDDKTLLIDGRLYDFDINKLSYKNYDHLSLSRCGMTIITNGEKLGYVSDNGERLIAPAYDTANDFVGGFARVGSGKETMLIDTSGEIVFSERGIEPKNLYDGCFCFKQDGRLGVFDANFNTLVEPSFTKIYMERVFGNFIIDTASYPKFYSITDAEYCSQEFIKILPTAGYFICQSPDNSFSLLNSDLEVLAYGLDSISYSEDVLLLEKDKRFCYYKKA